MNKKYRFMKALLACFLSLVLLLFFGCTSVKQNSANTATKLPFTIPDKDNLSASGKQIFYGPEASKMDITPIELFYYSLKDYCNSIVIAKYKGMEDEYKTHYALHNFELIEVIKGDFSEEEFQISAPQNKEYEDAIYVHDNYVKRPFKEGANCIVFLWKYDRILYGEEYVFSSIVISLDANNEIEAIQVENDVIDMGFKTIEELKAHLAQYVPLDEPGPVSGSPYTKSDKLEDALEVAHNVYKVKPITTYDPFEDKIRYECEVLEVLKGEKPLYPPVTVLWYDGVMEVGKEYILSASANTYMPVSKAHGIIPIEDTQRVNKVYELLGIQR